MAQTKNFFDVLEDVKKFLVDEGMERQSNGGFVRLNEDTRSYFVDQILQSLKQYLTSSGSEIKGSSSGDQEQDNPVAISSFKTCIEIAVLWGILPRLMKGVSISSSKRFAPMQFSSNETKSNENQNNIRKTAQHDHNSKQKSTKWRDILLSCYEEDKMTERQKYDFKNCIELYRIVSQLFDLAYNPLYSKFIRNVIIQNHISDLLGALVQMKTLSTTYQYMLPNSGAHSTENNNVLPGSGGGDGDGGGSGGSGGGGGSGIDHEINTCGRLTFSDHDTPASIVQTKVIGGLPESEKRNCKKMLDQILQQTPEMILVETFCILISQANSPKWIRASCYSLLTQTLLRPRGLFAVLHVMCESISDRSNSIRKYEKIIRVVTTKPKQCKTYEEYLSIICPQLVQLFHFKSKSQMEHVKRGAWLCAGQLLERHPVLAKRFLLELIAEPLLRFIEFQKKSIDKVYLRNDPEVLLNQNIDSEKPETIVVSEIKLVQCVEDIHQLLIGNPPSDPMLHLLMDVMPALFQLYCFVNQTKLNVKTACEEIISVYFRLSDDAVEAIKKLVVFQKRNPRKYYVTFAPGETGGVCIKKVLERCRDYLYEAQCVINILKLMKNDTVAGNLFIHLITQYTLMKNAVAKAKSEESKSLLMGDDEIEDNVVDEDSTLLLQVIKLIIDQLGISIMKNASHAISFVKFMLLSNEEDKESEEGIESVITALGILYAMLCGGIAVKTVEEGEKLEDLIPILERLTKHPNQQVAEMASTSQFAIDAKQYKQDDENVGTSEANMEQRIKHKIQLILNDLKDPILPVRAHGIRSFRSLVLDKNQIVKKYMKKILKIFETQLQDEDTYIYYAAIEGLTAMTDVYPDDTIPLITKAFLDKSVALEHRLKVGEALLLAAERCGQMLPKYAHHFVNTFLACCHEGIQLKPSESGKETTVVEKQSAEDDAYLRAGALSNIATLSEILRFGIHPFMQDIIDCASSLLFQQYEHVQVRRACIHVFSRMIKGLGKEVFQAIPDHVKQIWRMMKKAEFYDKDEIVRLSAKATAEDLHDICAQVLDIY